ncbi:MAG TPA: hypothetical protein PKY30_04245 [Myxococcota bacterium]|nr:hypothetical protein [Myxococcota bacterium]HNH46219.1 hypothetical protein [Myxococcota bacterium]
MEKAHKKGRLPDGFPTLQIAGRTITPLNNHDFQVEGRPLEAEPLEPGGVMPLCALNALPSNEEVPDGWVYPKQWAMRVDPARIGSRAEKTAEQWKHRIENILGVEAGEVIERKNGRYRLTQRLVRITGGPLADAPGIEVQVVERVSGPDVVHQLFVGARDSVAALAGVLARRLSLGLPMHFALGTFRTVVQLYKEATLLAEDALVIDQGVQNGDRLYAEFDLLIETRGGARGRGHVYRAEEDPDEDLRQELLAELRDRFATPGFLDD